MIIRSKFSPNYLLAQKALLLLFRSSNEYCTDYEFKSTALLYFPDIYAACQAIVPLRNAGAEAVELMDRASLRSIELLPGMPAIVKTLPPLAASLAGGVTRENNQNC
jgi:hypothetical protein